MMKCTPLLHDCLEIAGPRSDKHTNAMSRTWRAAIPALPAPRLQHPCTSSSSSALQPSVCEGATSRAGRHAPTCHVLGRRHQAGNDADTSFPRTAPAALAVPLASRALSDLGSRGSAMPSLLASAPLSPGKTLLLQLYSSEPQAACSIAIISMYGVYQHVAALLQHLSVGWVGGLFAWLDRGPL